MNGTSWTRARRLAPTLLGLALVGLVGCGGGEPAEEELVDETPSPAATMPEATVVEATQLVTNPATHEGQTVRINGVRVSSPLGSGAVWVDLPTGPQPTPFLVRAPTPPATGSTVDIVGTVMAMDEATVDEWVTSGMISENERLQAEFATHYIDAQAVQPAGM